MNIKRVGIDLAKQAFQVHGVDNHDKAVLRKQPKRGQFLSFFAELPPCLIGLEACGSAHHWGRELQKLGHITDGTAACEAVREGQQERCQ